MADEMVTPPDLTQPVQALGPQPTPGAPPLFTWEASEYIHHQKPFTWHLGFFAIGAAVAALLYFVLQDWFAVAVVVLMFIALFVYAVRKPDTLRYQISADGIDIGPKHYPYGRFRAFAVMQGAIPNIVLEPLQRFSPPISMYCAPEAVQTIVGHLTKYLPQTEKQSDVIDKLTHYLRF